MTAPRAEPLPDEPFLPAYGHGTLAEVMPSTAAALDVEGFVDTSTSPATAGT